MTSINPLALTQKEFTDQVYELLGKGLLHAGKYYSYLMQKGDGLKGYEPLEPQSLSLFQKIDQLIKLPSYTVKNKLVGGETEKYVLEFADSMIAELVIIPMKTGLSLCVSSQVGCKMACAFCETGRMGKLRDLKPEEIIAQVYFAKHVLGKPIKNIVFMGMGEPFDNYEALNQALHILTDPKGLGFGPSRITVSTSGLVPKILEFITWGQKGVKLAVSINGSNNQNRSQVMPVTRRYDMDTLKQSLLEFTGQTGSKIFAEYVMMKGINDDLLCASELASYLDSVPCMINLIPYNAQSHDRFSPPEADVVKAFQAQLVKAGHQVYVRQNKGDAIMAACGQLGEINLKKRLLQKANSF